MPVNPSYMETVEFDDPALANSAFGPQNAHLDILARKSGAKLGNRGTNLFIESENPKVRQTLCHTFVQLYSLLRQGMVLGEADMARAYDMLHNDPGLNLSQIFRGCSVCSNYAQDCHSTQFGTKKNYLELLCAKELVFSLGACGHGQNIPCCGNGSFHAAKAQGQTHYSYTASCRSR